MSISPSRWFAVTLAASCGIGVSSVALAQVDVGVNIGIPGAVIVSPGWYGDRYYDGHRYWQRREWEDRHRNERDWHDARAYRGGPPGDWGHGHEGGAHKGDRHNGHENGGGRRGEH
ncbi:hypothetical protein [Caballeronia mineralivorans]|uniref:hypothetical protein n=1 Tax=Caballeronia mineralivorans TaxID=2010198 RepID=UPI0023F21AA7|nr:hypothetical protein [Caballeronia mineralivorans]